MKYIHPVLETDRLIIKRGKYKDYVKVYEYNFTYLRNINGEFEFVKQEPEIIEEFYKEAEEKENMMDLIVYLKTGEAIANIVLDRYDEKLNSLEISINVHPNYWGHGYAKEAIVEIMKYVFDNLNIDNILYVYALENVKSKRASEKIGFEYLSSFTEHYKRIDKDIIHEKTIMSKERFYELYVVQKKIGILK